MAAGLRAACLSSLQKHKGDGWSLGMGHAPGLLVESDRLAH